MSNPGNITLAIESAIRGGSISLLSHNDEIAHWIGSSGVSKAEDLLATIDTMLAENNISLNQIGLIAVSAGPGSFTGIRIGIATALGLKNGLGVEMSSVSALESAVFGSRSDGQVTVALPVGRNAVCLQAFKNDDGEITEMNEPHTVTEAEFTDMVLTDRDTSFLVHESLHELVGDSANIVNLGSNLAFSVGLTCGKNPGVCVAPLFISKSF